MIKLVLFGAACVLAVIISACSREDRRALTLCALVILADWLVSNMPWIYVDASYEAILWSWGIDQRQEDGMALSDVLALIATAWLGRGVWWGMMLPSICFAKLAMHVVAMANSLKYHEYCLILDAALCTQLAVLFALGGDGVCDLLRGGWRDRVALRLPVLAPYLAGRYR